MKLGYLGQEVTLQDPDGFKIEPFEIAKIDRTASGKKVKDVIAVKHRYTLFYKALEPEDVRILVNFYLSGDSLSFLYSDSGEEKQAVVDITSIPRELFIYDWQYSENINITLEEV